MSSHRPILNAAAILAAFALAGVGLVNWVQSATAERIAASQRQSLLRTLEALVPPSDYDNDLVTDVVEVQDSSLGGKAPVYRARQRGRPVALVVGARAPDGYNGEIKMLVAVRADGSLLGVRVIEHRETPGLGDGIELEKSGWIRGFDGLSLNDPPERSWRVKRDGGSFDQFTGATITPRAVVKAVKNVLLYVAGQRDMLFAAAAAARE